MRDSQRNPAAGKQPDGFDVEWELAEFQHRARTAEPPKLAGLRRAFSAAAFAALVLAALLAWPFRKLFHRPFRAQRPGDPEPESRSLAQEREAAEAPARALPKARS